MPVTIVVNKMTPSHKGSNGTSIAFPDVCKTPTPAGPIPIPYPNVAMSKDLIKGSTTVKMDGQSISVKGYKFSMSTGVKAGSAMVVASNKIKGQAEFANYSFDIKMDGKNVAPMNESYLRVHEVRPDELLVGHFPQRQHQAPILYPDTPPGPPLYDQPLYRNCDTRRIGIDDPT